MPISMDLGFRERRALVVSWTSETNEASDVNRFMDKVVKIVLKLGFVIMRGITNIMDPLPMAPPSPYIVV
jgi:hypothetical protein